MKKTIKKRAPRVKAPTDFVQVARKAKQDRGAAVRWEAAHEARERADRDAALIERNARYQRFGYSVGSDGVVRVIATGLPVGARKGGWAMPDAGVAFDRAGNRH